MKACAHNLLGPHAELGLAAVVVDTLSLAELLHSMLLHDLMQTWRMERT